MELVLDVAREVLQERLLAFAPRARDPARFLSSPLAGRFLMFPGGDAQGFQTREGLFVDGGEVVE